MAEEAQGELHPLIRTGDNVLARPLLESNREGSVAEELKCGQREGPGGGYDGQCLDWSICSEQSMQRMHWEAGHVDNHQLQQVRGECH